MTKPPPQTALVIGHGSIGARHRRVLAELGLDVGVVSRRRDAGDFTDLATALAARQPELVVVATETADHARQVERLVALDFRGRVLVEKPLFTTPHPLPAHRFAALAVGYDLRFHPVLQHLAQALTPVVLGSARLVSAQIYVGQYLPDWRPGRDYRTLYSAHRAEGGGALRDLSHELDVANWLLGPWQSLAALGGHWSDLEIDSDDTFLLLGRFARCPAATIQVNYLDRQVRRDVVINTSDHTFTADLIAGTLRRDQEPPVVFALERDQLYRDLHQAVLAGGAGPCTASEAQRVDTMVDAAERAARDGVWQVSGTGPT